MTSTADAPGIAQNGSARRGAVPSQKTSRKTSDRSSQGGRGHQPIVIGGAPRADLLPTEVHVDRRQRAAGRRAWAGVVVVAIAVGIGAGAAAVTRMSAQDDLTAAEAETSTLLQQQLQFKDVRSTEKESALLESAQQVGGSTEIDWARTLGAVRGALPSDVSIAGVAIDSATALQAYGQSDDPLQGRRVATLTIDAKSATLPSVPDWLTAVRGVKGFVDATTNTVTRDDTGIYTVNMTIHLDEKAYDARYAAKKG